MRSISSDELLPIVRQLKKNKLFSGFSDDNVKEFVNNCKLRLYEPNDAIWRRGGSKLDYMIVREGWLIVWNDDYGKETIDALVTAGQIIGEFEFLGYKPKSSKIKALTDCELLSSTKSNLEKLCAIDEGLFYRNLSKSLVDKLQSQNTLQKFTKFRNVEKRLIYFLNNFTVTPEWQKFTNINDGADIDDFEIEIYWTSAILSGLLSTEGRTLEPKLAKLISSGDLEISFFDCSHKKIENGKAVESTDFDSLFSEADFFKIKVLDYKKLTQIVEV